MTLEQAEERLRELGLTGGDAFDALTSSSPSVEVAPVIAGLGEREGWLSLAYERFHAGRHKGRLGQFFTPRAMVSLMLAHCRVEGAHVLDPTAGSGQLLTAARAAGARLVSGIEIHERLVSLANHRLGAQVVRCADFFAAKPTPVEVVLANPPFSVRITDRNLLAKHGVERDSISSDVLFVRTLHTWVQPGGRACVVLPYSLVHNPSHEETRRALTQHFGVERLLVLPEGVFRPFGGAGGRAVIAWLNRRPTTDAVTLWGELIDPGYDVRSRTLRETSPTEVNALCHGQGFVPIVGWTPERSVHEGVPVGELAHLRKERAAARPGPLVELTDLDRETGELSYRMESPSGRRRPVVEDGDLLFSRLRPELGQVGLHVGPQALGSSEWIVLERPRFRHVLWHALRTPAFRERLPPTGGQVRPRLDPAAMLSSTVRWPTTPTLEDIEGLSARLLADRLTLKRRLLALQHAMDRYQAGCIDEEELADEVARIKLAMPP